MAIADTDPSKKEAHETSTSKNSCDNGSKKMLNDQSTSKLLSVNRNYFNIKDFAFNMPGGWDNQTVSIFVLTCKKLKGEFLHHDTPADGLKIWQKIVKKCSEESNNNSVFNVNNVIELAQSLKEYVLRNENKKNEEDFNLLYNDVSDLLEYFPSETIETNSNLMMRQRTRSESIEMKTTAPNPEPLPTRRTPSTYDVLIIKSCNEVRDILTNPKSSAKIIWKKVSDHMSKTSGVNLDVRQYLSNFKRVVVKELKKERDDAKRAALFLDLVGDYKSIFDYMPPRTIKSSDFITEEDLAMLNGSDRIDDKSSKDMVCSNVETTSEESTVNEQVKSGNDFTNDSSPSPRTLRTSPRLANISEKKSVDQDSGTESEMSCSVSEPETPPPPPRVINKRKRSKQHILKSTSHIDAKRAHIKTQQQVVKSGDLISPSGSALPSSVPSVSSGKTTIHADSSEMKNRSKSRLKDNSEESSSVEISQQQSPLKMAGVSEVEKVDGNSGSPGSFLTPPARLEAVAPIGKPVQPSTAVDKTVPRLVANHHSELPRPNHTPAEADHSQSAGDSDPGPSRVSSDVSQLVKFDSSSLRIIDSYKQKMKESHASQAILQVVPRTGLTAQLATISDTPQDNQAVLPTNGSQLDGYPPRWFDKFFADYKKHEMWKMHQMLKMQQELVDMENKKLSVLERILSSLNDRTS